MNWSTTDVLLLVAAFGGPILIVWLIVSLGERRKRKRSTGA